MSDWALRDAENNCRRLILVRWLAGGLLLVLTFFCIYALDLPLPEYQLYGLGWMILGYNLLLAFLTQYTHFLKNPTLQRIQSLIILQISLDWLSMGILIHFTGGVTSPTIILLIIHAVLVTVMLPDQPPFLYAAVAVGVVLIVALLEQSALLPHYDVIHMRDNADDLYTRVQITFFSVALFTTVYLTRRITNRLYARERQALVLLQTARDTSTLQLNLVLEQLTKNVALALSVAGASIRLLDASGEYLTLVASYGLSQTYLKKGSVGVSQSRLDQEALSGTAILIREISQDPRIQYQKEMAEEGIHSLLVVPVIGHRPLGVLRAYSDLPNRFKSSDAEFLQAIAYYSATAIENALIYEDLQQAEQRRSQFIRQITHELRAPVTGTQSLLRVLLNNMAGEISPQQVDILKRSEHRMEALLQLITDLLSLATSQSEILVTKLETIPLQPLLQSIVDGMEAQAKEKNIEFRLFMPSIPLQVKATEDGLRQVFENLIGNALKYTLIGGSVKVELEKQANTTQVKVMDTGIGIPETALEHLGEEFYRATNARHSEIAGTGLGLAIVKQYLTTFEGLLNIQSEENKGTCITVTLPLA